MHRLAIATAITAALTLPAIGQAQTAQLQRIGGYTSGLGEGSIEISAFDPGSGRVASVNGVDDSFDLIDLSNPAVPALVQRVSTAALGSPNSVASSNGLFAVAIQSATPQNAGKVAFYSNAGALLGSVAVGSLPDMVTFTPDGRYLLVANEGEPGTDYNVDPEGSVSIIDIGAGVAAASVREVRFVDFNVGAPRNGELPPAVRIFSPGASVAQDLEPEYITVTPDSRTAFVSLQENNALAVIDIEAGTVSRILALGFKDHLVPGQGIDPSDRDLPGNQPAISIRNVPVYGMYQPDAIAVTTDANGQPVVLTANEGDSRDYDAFSEETRVGSGSYVLDPSIFPDAATLKQNANLGRLNVTKTLGDVDLDGDFDAIYAFGARSMSAFDGNSGALVFDSGDSFEQIIAAQVPALFNSEGDAAGFDSRSDNKGPEPEGIAIGDVGGRKYAFVGLERIGGAFVFDVTDPRNPQQLGYSLAQGGDISPEGVAYISPQQSPNQRALVLMSHEVSGSLGVYELDTCTVSAISLFAPDQVQITGYCPSGLDLYCVRQGNPVQLATSISVNTQSQFTAPLQFGDRCYAALPGQSSAINGIDATLNRVAIPASSPLGSLLLALVSMLLGALTLRRQLR